MSLYFLVNWQESKKQKQQYHPVNLLSSGTDISSDLPTKIFPSYPGYTSFDIQM